MRGLLLILQDLNRHSFQLTSKYFAKTRLIMMVSISREIVSNDYWFYNMIYLTKYRRGPISTFSRFTSWNQATSVFVWLRVDPKLLPQYMKVLRSYTVHYSLCYEVKYVTRGWPAQVDRQRHNVPIDLWLEGLQLLKLLLFFVSARPCWRMRVCELSVATVLFQTQQLIPHLLCHLLQPVIAKWLQFQTTIPSALFADRHVRRVGQLCL